MDTNKKFSILIIDDTPHSIKVLGHSLSDDYNVMIATGGRQALQLLEQEMLPDLILLDVVMPGMDGYETCRRLKNNNRTKDIPVIFVTAKFNSQDEEKGFTMGAVDYIIKPVCIPVVMKRIETQLAIYNQNKMLERKVQERTKELHDTQKEIIRRLCRAADYRDDLTGKHIIRMSKYAQLIALHHGLSEFEATLILNAAPMHDIGKIGISDEVLFKPDKHSEEEKRIMDEHPLIGAEIIGEHKTPLLKLAKECALTHHERWDGKGYPRGLKGADIPLVGRIVAIADAFDSITTERPYKKAWTVDEAVEEIKGGKGTQFDPVLVDVFLDILPDIIRIKEQYS